MRREPEEIEGDALPVYGDPVPKRNENLYHSFYARSEVTRHAFCDPLEHVGMFLCRNPTVDCV